MDHSTTERMAENLLPYFNNSLKFSDSIINAKDDLHVLSSLILLVLLYFNCMLKSEMLLKPSIGILRKIDKS